MGKILFPKYFPSCPTDGAEYIVEGFTDAITSNIANTMKMFWRPRKIKLSGQYFTFSEITRTCIVPADYELIIKSPYASEEEMVCEPARPWVLESSTNIDNPELSFGWDSKPFYKGNQESLFTFNNFSILLSNRERCSGTILIQQWYATEGEGRGPFDYQTINILGVDFNMATYVNEFGRGYLQPSIEVTEWWSFGGTYDTETGEPL